MSEADQDLLLFGDLARALVELDGITDLRRFRLPYPRLAQRTFDRIVLRCLVEEAEPPLSVPGLIRWCHQRPLAHWPITASWRVFSEEDVLLNGDSGALEEICHELALLAERPADPLSAITTTLTGAADACRRTGDERAYRYLRRLLVTHPVLGNEQLNEISFGGELGPIDAAVLKQLYVAASDPHQHDGGFTACGECGNLLISIGAREWWCERAECRREGPDRLGGRCWDSDDGTLFHLNRRCRQFVSGPGRSVLRLSDRLGEIGLVAAGGRIELWPEFGAHDLRITFPGSAGWIIDVADWRSPALLGLAIGRVASETFADQAFWVVPDYRIRDDAAYFTTVNEFLGERAGDVLVRSESDVVERARRLLGGQRGG